MSTLDSPTKSSISAEVDPTSAASRGSLRPLEYIGITPNLGGHYSGFFKTGAATVIAGAGAIFSARWGDSSHNMILNKVWASFSPTTGFTAAQLVDVDIVKVTGFSVADTGGTTITPGTSGKKKTSMGNSLVADMRIATTVALTNGTGTADANPFGGANLYQQFAVTSANAILGLQPVYDFKPGHEHPMVFSAGEGFRVRIVTTLGTAGVGNFSILLDWAEAAAVI
jgi:hypothetical protein